MNHAAFLTAAVGLCTVASAQQCEIYVIGPSSLWWGQTFTAQVWGAIGGEPYLPGTSAIAAFGIDILTAHGGFGIESMTGPTIAPWAADFGVEGELVGTDIIGTSGGQLPNLYGILNPNINMSDPILLFTFDVTIRRHWWGSMTFQPANPDPNGGLAFYPISTEPLSIAAPNDPGTTLTFNDWTLNVLPTPASLMPLAWLGLVAVCRPGRTRSQGVIA